MENAVGLDGGIVWNEQQIGEITVHYAYSNYFVKYFCETQTVVIYKLVNEKLVFHEKYNSYYEFRNSLIDKYDMCSHQ